MHSVLCNRMPSGSVCALQYHHLAWCIQNADCVLLVHDDDGTDISDYSVSQPTLEQVFLSFAAEQLQADQVTAE
jgi:hypothetical protein